MNYFKRLTDFRDEVRNFIVSSVAEGQTITFFDGKFITNEQGQIDFESDEMIDEFYELPEIVSLRKHGIRYEYSVVSITKNGKDVDIKGIGRGDVFGEEAMFSEYDLDFMDLCIVADLISSK